MTLICVPIFVDDPAAALGEARAARDGGADLVEFRIDTYYTGDDDEKQVPAIVKLASQSPLPCIVTCRPVLEGGHYGGPDAARISLFERLGTASGTGEFPPRYIDVELATYQRSENIRQKVRLAVDHPDQLRDVNTALILSTHDFQTRPADLFRRIAEMTGDPACRVAKIAYRARSLRDNLELLDILVEAKAAGRPMVALGMGPFGLMSRVLAPKFDGFLTFASMRRSAETAPGQPVLSELLEEYRFRSINPATRVYGVVGWPVEHSISPLIHNAGFEAVGHDGVYLPLPVPPEFEHFKATVVSMLEHPHLDLCGLSVTIPHKESLVRLAREAIEHGDDRWSLDSLSEVCGAANTLTVTRDPRGGVTRLAVENTDGPGAVAVLSESIGDLRGRKIVLLGAGGTARSLAAAFICAGAQVLVVNRTAERAERLITELSRRLPPTAPLSIVNIERLGSLAPDAVFNCTSVGMSSGSAHGQSPLTEAELRTLPGSCVICESVYSPILTPLLALSRAIGMNSTDGVQFFVAQAAYQFERWSRCDAPRRLFERVARETLLARAAGQSR